MFERPNPFPVRLSALAILLPRRRRRVRPLWEAGFLGCLPRTALARRLATGAGIVAAEHCLLGIESMALVVGEAVGLGGERGHCAKAGEV
jgi:hypothetical protein